MIFSIKFVDANVFIKRWYDPKAEAFTDSLDREQHCTSVLVLLEVYHKLRMKNVQNTFGYIRSIMGSIKVHDILSDDLFNAMKSPTNININDKVHIAVMRRNNISTIISYDTDFDREKGIRREEP